MSIDVRKRAIHETPADHIMLVEWDVFVDGKRMPFTIDSIAEGYASKSRANEYAAPPYGYSLVRKIAYAVAKTYEAIEFFNRFAAAMWRGGDEKPAVKVYPGGVVEYRPAGCSKSFRFKTPETSSLESALRSLDARLDLFDSAIFEAEGRFTAATTLQIMEGILKEIYASS